LGGDEAEMGTRGEIGDSVNNYISVVLLTVSEQMSKKQYDQQTCMHIICKQKLSVLKTKQR